MGGPMRINLKPDAQPFKVSVARQIPLRFQKNAELALKEFINSGVIVKVSEPTEWCAPGMFVEKPGTNGKVGMVTDFTKLNKYVKRPVHPFPSASEIRQAIPPNQKFFAK